MPGGGKKGRFQFFLNPEKLNHNEIADIILGSKRKDHENMTYEELLGMEKDELNKLYIDIILKR
jgi:hypothetical protein